MEILIFITIWQVVNFFCLPKYVRVDFAKKLANEDDRNWQSSKISMMYWPIMIFYIPYLVKKKIL